MIVIPEDPQPQCIRCRCFMAYDGAPCGRCSWPEIYDGQGNVMVPWPRQREKDAALAKLREQARRIG